MYVHVHIYTHACAHIQCSIWRTCPVKEAQVWCLQPRCTWGSENEQQRCAHSGLLLAACCRENVPALLCGDSPNLPDSLSSWAFPPLTVPMATALFLPNAAFAAAYNHIANILWPSQNPRPSLATQTLPVSKCHCIKCPLCPAGHHTSLQEIRGSPSAEQGFLLSPWERPPWAGICGSSGSGFCVKGRRKRKLLSGPLVVIKRRGRGWLGSKGFALGLGKNSSLKALWGPNQICSLLAVSTSRKLGVPGVW